MGILEKHLGKGESIKVGEDEIVLKPLGTEELPDFLKLFKSMSKLDKKGLTDEEFGLKIFSVIDDESLNSLKNLINKTLELSLPNEPESDRKVFGLKYMMLLLPKIMEINMQAIESSKGSDMAQKLEAIRKIKEKAKK